MEATVAKTGTEGKPGEEEQTPQCELRKVDDVVFIVSDALTFSGFIASYGFKI